EVAKVLDVGVAAPLVETADERRAVGGHQHGVVAADLDAALGVSGVLGEHGRRADENLTAHSAREAHPVAVHLGPVAAEQVERSGVVVKVDADLLEDGLGVVLDRGEDLFGSDLVDRYAPGDVGRALRCRLFPGRAPRVAPAAAPAAVLLGHCDVSPVGTSGNPTGRAAWREV